MSKEELKQWLIDHAGDEWAEERERVISEHQELADELLKDVIGVIKQSLLAMVNEVLAEDVERQLEDMTEFPDAKDVLKKFGIN